MRHRRRTKKRTTRKLKKTMLKVVRFTILSLLLPLMVGVSIGGFLAFARSVPSIADLKSDVIPPSTKIYADDDVLIGELKVMKGQHMEIKKVPQDMINAVISVEDSHFWQHSGIDYLAIVRAATKDILRRHLKEGGSTITQQLAKITFLTPEKTFKRKIKEAILAHRIERDLSKEEIMELYLNRVYFGHGAYGIEMAARSYFGKTAEELTLPEAALLAGLLKSPSAYSPYSNIKKARNRQEIVLRRMEEEGHINRRQKVEARKAQIYLSKASTRDESKNYFIRHVKAYLEKKYGAEAVYKGGLRVYTTLDRNAQAAAQRAIQQGLRDLEKRRGWRGPIAHRDIDPGKEHKSGVFFRTMPPGVGDIVQAVVLAVDKQEAIVEMSGLVGSLLIKDAEWANKVFDYEIQEPVPIEEFDLEKILIPGDVIMVRVKSMKDGIVKVALEQEPEAQGALVALESHSGYIRALVGGYDFRKSEYNRALYAKRQAGSAFKPVIYAVALNNGFTPASVLLDEAITFEDEPVEDEFAEEESAEDESVEDESAEDESAEDESAEDESAEDESAEEEDDNIWTPRNYDEEFHGPTRLRDALAYSRNVVTVKLVDDIGIEKIIKFATKLGMKRSELPRDLTLSLGSLSISPLDLTSSYGAFANGGVKMQPIGIKYVTDRKGRVIESNEPTGVRVMNLKAAFLMTSMLRDVVNYGTGRRAKALKRPVAGKTGTTNEYRDAWFLGYTTEMVTGVWVGFDDMKPLGPEETGSRAASPIWVDFMKTVSADTAPRDFPMPDGIVTRLIDPATGLLANRWTENAVLEYFKEGTEPTTYTPTIWQTNEPENPFF
jgi:penicillin-binding protein 1A